MRVALIAATMIAAAAPAEPMLELDPRCPYCHKEHDVGETFEGHGHDCRSCGRHIVAVAFTESGVMLMVRGEPEPESGSTGRQRTRRLWKKRGRR